MKKYYSAVKPYYKRKRLRFGFKIFKAIFKIFFPKDEFIWKGEKPKDDEPCLFVSNHTKLYAPLSFILNFGKPIRAWSNAYFLFFKEAANHMFKNVIANRKPKFLLYPFTVMILPLIVWFFRGLEPIPVYHQDRKVMETFDKSLETFESGINQVVFPEKLEGAANKYIFEFNRGFTYIAKLYYEKTGKKLKFYPVYTCQSLRKVLIGTPISYDPEIPIKKQKNDICKYLEGQIKELGDSLPEHRIVVYE